ncbi:MAG TPA: FAD binding domain-containing protein [Candidatus Dormibacteraeota bacterium]
MISQELEYLAPVQLSEALAALDRYGDKAKLLAGGMSLMPMMNLALVEPEVIISLNHLAGLDQIQEDGAVYRLGAMVRHHQLAESEAIRRHFPLLADAAAGIGDVQVRHRGTLGGSIAHADPAADYLTVMVALGARFKVESAGGKRTIEAGDFFLDIMTTKLEASELLVEVEIPKLPAGARSAYLRLATVEGSFPLANAAAVQGGGSTRIAVGGVTPKPFLVSTTSANSPDGGLPDDVPQAVAAACRDIAGPDADYRRALAQVCVQRVVARLM